MNTESKDLIAWLRRIKEKYRTMVPQPNYYKPMKSACSILISTIRGNTKLYANQGYMENQQQLIKNCNGRFFEIAAMYLMEELDT